jgi:hypothetical protein
MSDLPQVSRFRLLSRCTLHHSSPRPAPRRQVFVTARGEYEVTAGDGTIRRFPEGSVLLLEDTTGAGHSTRITSGEECIVFAVGLANATT